MIFRTLDPDAGLVAGKRQQLAVGISWRHLANLCCSNDLAIAGQSAPVNYNRKLKSVPSILCVQLYLGSEGWLFLLEQIQFAAKGSGTAPIIKAHV
jgi:hypothetical protein